MLKYILPIMIITLCGCHAKEKFIENMNHYYGKTEAQLISHYGIPSKFYKLEDGTKYITFSSSHVEGYGYANQYGGSNYVTTYHCSLTFTLDAKTKKVIKWNASGNDCY